MTYLPLFVAGTILCSDGDSTKKSESSAYKYSVRAMADSRMDLIRSPAPSETRRSWEGVYHGPSLLGVSEKHGYVLQITSSFGRSSEIGRIVVASTDPVEFTFDRSGIRDATIGKLVVVKWGERHYLVRKAEMLSFCNSFNAEPHRGALLAAHWLKEGDGKKPVRGLPRVPQEWQPYLLDAPLTLVVSNVDSKVVRRSVVGERKRLKGVEATVPINPKWKLKEGMILFAEIGTLNKCYVTDVQSKIARLLIVVDNGTWREVVRPGVRVWSRFQKAFEP